MCMVAVFQSSVPRVIESQSTKPVSAVQHGHDEPDDEREPPGLRERVVGDAELAEHGETVAKV